MKKRVILFGAGDLLKESLRFINKKNVKIIAITDNDKKKWGNRINGIRVINPDFLTKVKFDYIIISNAAYKKEIQLQLRNMGIRNILPLYAESYTEEEKKIISLCLTVSGKHILKYRNFCHRQEFYPSLAGMWINPYYFSRKNLLKHIKENRKYMKGKCLDFGCGTKPYQELFSVTEYIGVDIQTDYCKKEDSDIIYYDGNKIPFEDEYFDSIISSQVFEHISNLDEIILEINRVLKMNGHILLTVPFTYPEHLKPYDYKRYTSHGIIQYLQKNGFEVVEFEKTGNSVETIAQLQDVFINEKIFPNIRQLDWIKKTIILFINLKAAILSKILTDDKDLYLDNLVVAKKIKSFK